MRIPEGAPYEDKYLNDKDKWFMRGWDLAVESVMEALADIAEETETGSDTLTKIYQELIEDVKDEVDFRAVSDRQMHVVSFIDGYSDEELKNNGYNPGE